MKHSTPEITKEEIHAFVEELRLDLGKVSTRFVEDAILGITRSQSVRLTDISRALQEKISLHATHKRLCRNLADPGIGVAVNARLLELGANRIKKDSLLFLCPTRLRKKYAKRMEYMGGTENDQIDSAVTECKLWEVIGCDTESEKITPLTQTVWSDNDFGVSETDGILKLVDRALEGTQERGLLLADSWCDRPELLNAWTMDAGRRYLVRQHSDSLLMHNNTLRSVRELSELCDTPYGKTMFKYVDQSELDIFIHFGFLPVRLPECSQYPLRLLVIKGMGKDWAILTTESLRWNREVLFSMVQTYLKIYQIARDSRSIMQQFDFGDIRVLSYARLKNLLSMLMAASYLTAVKQDLTLNDRTVQFDRRDSSAPLPLPGHLAHSVKSR